MRRSIVKELGGLAEAAEASQYHIISNNSTLRWPRPVRHDYCNAMLHQYTFLTASKTMLCCTYAVQLFLMLLITVLYYGRITLILVEMLSFAAPVMMSLISYMLLDVWSHARQMSVFIHRLEHLCCFCSSCCLLEKVAVVVPCCNLRNNGHNAIQKTY